jgi:type I restriction enzyme, S subunit
MVEELKRYPAMKEAGLPWLEHVPEHWKLLPNGALVRQRKVIVGDRHTEYRLLSLTKQGVTVRDMSAGGKFSADMDTFQEVRSGDLIFCLFDVPETPRTVGLSPHDGMITSAYTVFECPDPTLAAFINLFYRAMDDRKLLSPLYSGLRNTIPLPRFLSAKTPVPMAEERASIVRFIDHADRRIRQAIHAKQKLIALLNEQKQVVIHRSVTRGLDSHVRLKSSGIRQLGDVPIAWKIARLKTRLVANDSGAWGDEPSQGGGTIVLRSTEQAVDGTWRIEEPARRGLSDRERRATLLREGDLVVTKSSGSPTHIGKASLVDQAIAQMECGFSNFMQRLRVDRHTLPEFVWLVLNSPLGRLQLVEGSSTTTGLGNLTGTILGNLWVAFPPRSEQEAICAQVSRKTRPIDAAITRAEGSVRLLREYRTRLTTDVVTGELDVRDAAARLPEDSDDESEPIDEIGGLDLTDEPEADDLQPVDA